MASLSIPTDSSESSDDQSLMSVLELTKKPLLSVPQQYVRTDHKSPAIDLFNNSKKPCTNSFPAIPTIDFKNLMTDETSDLELEKLHFTCKDWGVFQLVNHEVSPTLLQNLKHEVEGFFHLPIDEKMKYRIRPGDFEGYGSFYQTSDQKLDWIDRVYMITNPIHRRKPHLLPQFPSSLRTTLESYFVELEKLAMKIMLLLAKALKIEEREMVVKELFEDGMQSMRMNYYPACPQPEAVVGISPHSDINAITILHQLNGVDGLEIKKDGAWIPVVNVPQQAFVVNVGDILEIMSNGIYKSVEHTAIPNSIKERISIAMFFTPNFKSEIRPFNSLINPNNPPLFKSIGVEKYVNGFFSRRKLNGKSFLEQMKIEN